ncbi:chromatin structure-remodeling complex subunit RSC7 [Ceratocystis pirilliformis]|uniref:Chromatin structure-remodeling complex subunit RSC7 n=1 Tax=Ceratocystis pirilliformis TaxID=259994 RepID=A0ABR3ZPF2_9PEZI
MGRRSGRAAARRANAALGTTPHGFESIPDDEPVPDVPASSSEADEDENEENEDNEEEQPDNGSGDEDGEEEGEGQDDDGDEGDANEAGDPDENDNDENDDEDDEDDEQGEDKKSSPQQPVVRRKRLGRPPKIKPPDWDLGVIVQPGEETRPRRGRGGWRGRGGRKGVSTPSKPVQTIDKEGTVVDIINDECDLPEDPEGETKVDKLGYLKGGRDYRCRTFTVVGRGDRLYMLSTEPARCVGFRDSYLFFTKHLRLYKIIVVDEEKKDMIEREIIPHSYKGRAIGIVTARSVFREFGARIIVGGRRITDDYEVAQARQEGVKEGELADGSYSHASGDAYNKNQYVAWHGASSVYHQNMAGGAPPPHEKIPHHTKNTKKRRANVNDLNWMYEHALQASIYNSNINAMRQHQHNGIYNIHTNAMHYPVTFQPTRACAEVIPIGDDFDSASSIFPPVSRRIARNFYVVDLVCETPPAGVSPAVSLDPVAAAAAAEAAPGTDMLAQFRGLSAVSQEIQDLLPSECREAFNKAKKTETEWVQRWATEKDSMSRRQPVIDKAIVPYPMMA